MKNFCTNCGNQLNEEDKFCSSCGNFINYQVGKNYHNSTKKEDESYIDNAKAKSKWWNTGWLWVVILFFWPVGLYGLYRRYPKNAKKALIGFACLWVLSIVLNFLGIGKPSHCDCLNALVYQDKNFITSDCVNAYFDEAFDYAETYNPNTKYTSQMAVIQSYLYEKCK